MPTCVSCHQPLTVDQPKRCTGCIEDLCDTCAWSNTGQCEPCRDRELELAQP